MLSNSASVSPCDNYSFLIRVIEFSEATVPQCFDNIAAPKIFGNLPKNTYGRVLFKNFFRVFPVVLQKTCLKELFSRAHVRNDLRKGVEILAKLTFSFSIIVFNMMKPLVILFIMKLIAQINIFKYVTQKHGQSAVKMLVSGSVKTNSTVTLSQEIFVIQKKLQGLSLQFIDLLFTKKKLH